MHPHRHHKLIIALLAVLGTTLYLAATTFGASTGGAIKIFVLPSLNSGGGGKIIFTGAIGDAGTTTKSGPNGVDTTAQLKNGTIVLSLAQLKTKINNAFGHGDKATCSLENSVSGNLPIVSGTGAYAKLTGSATVKFTVALVARKNANGKCGGLSKPIAEAAVVTGSGTVSFG